MFICFNGSYVEIFACSVFECQGIAQSGQKEWFFFVVVARSDVFFFFFEEIQFPQATQYRVHNQIRFICDIEHDIA